MINKIINKYDLVDIDKNLNTLPFWRLVNKENTDKYIDTTISTKTYINIDGYDVRIDYRNQIRIKFGGNIYKTNVYINDLEKLEEE